MRTEHEPPRVRCDLCGKRIPVKDQELAATTPEGWWCPACVQQISFLPGNTGTVACA